MTGLVALVLAIILSLLNRKYPWHQKWVAHAIAGLPGCGVVFILIFTYARLYG
jgi:hypothetical protein